MHKSEQSLKKKYLKEKAKIKYGIDLEIRYLLDNLKQRKEKLSNCKTIS